MSINLSVPQNEAVELKPRITVIGVGGAGGNAVNNMINAKLEGVDFVVANTDAQSLAFSKTDRRIQLGTGLTQGLGAGSKPEIGRAAAEETIEEINAQIKGSHMVFIAAGMGGIAAWPRGMAAKYSFANFFACSTVMSPASVIVELLGT